MFFFQPKSDDLNLDVLQENGEIKYFGTLSGDPNGVIHGKILISINRSKLFFKNSRLSVNRIFDTFLKYYV